MARVCSEQEEIVLVTSTQGFLINLSLENSVMKKNFTNLSADILDMYKQAVAEDFSDSTASQDNLHILNPIYRDYLHESNLYLQEKVQLSGQISENEEQDWLEEI